MLISYSNQLNLSWPTLQSIIIPLTTPNSNPLSIYMYILGLDVLGFRCFWLKMFCVLDILGFRCFVF